MAAPIMCVVSDVVVLKTPVTDRDHG